MQVSTTKIRSHILETWQRLVRSQKEVLSVLVDPKMPDPYPVLYISRKENPALVTALFRKKLSPEDFKKLSVQILPEHPEDLKQHGLLYLPHDYVVPGGRFNEMYGWDTYFIELGLLESGQVMLAKNMVDNIVYEIDFYGTLLNANRAWSLERSQPPMLAPMVLALYEKTHDRRWLASVIPALEKLYHFWMKSPRYLPEVGLNRYYAGGQGPAPEESPAYYEKITDYYEQHPQIPEYDREEYFDPQARQLTPFFYVADRTVRESGFDITAKYGPFGAGIIYYAPVDLNVLLYQMEIQMAKIYQLLGQRDRVGQWRYRAERRRAAINRYLWNESEGFYFDYNIKTKKQDAKIYATGVWPLWAGLATKMQAQRVADRLRALLMPGGLMTSLVYSGAQWDAPFGWAPLQYFAVQGLNRYGYREFATEIAARFVKTIESNFENEHMLFEKYDVEKGDAETHAKIEYGYRSNEPGFGWTNAIWLVFRKYLGS